jgi:hypothetical protein
MYSTELVELKKDTGKYAEHLRKRRDAQRLRYISDPEYRAKQLEHSKKLRLDPVYRKKHNDLKAVWLKKKLATDNNFKQRYIEQTKKARKKYQVKKIVEDTCNILLNHGDILKEDPDHIQTDFLIMLINRDDKQ